MSAVQEAFEFLTKALCMVAEVDYPKTHHLNRSVALQLLKVAPSRLNAVPTMYGDISRWRSNESPMLLVEISVALGPASEMLEGMAEVTGSEILALTMAIDSAYIQRMLFLANWWAQFYTVAKYGDEILGVPPSLLFTSREAALAVEHLREAGLLIYRLQMKLIESVREAVVDVMKRSGSA